MEAIVLAPAAMGELRLPICLGYLLTTPAEEGALSAAIGSCLGALLFLRESERIWLLSMTAAGALGAAVFAGTGISRHPLFAPILSAGISASFGFLFLSLEPEPGIRDLTRVLLQTASAAGSAWALGADQRAVEKAMICMGLCRFTLFHCLNLGVLAAMVLTWTDGNLPAAALCGLGVDLAASVPAPLLPVLCLGFVTRSRGPMVQVLWCLPAMLLARSADPVLPVSVLLSSGLCTVFHRPVIEKASLPAPEAGARLQSAAAALELVSTLLSRRTETVDKEELTAAKLQRVCGDCMMQMSCSVITAQEVPPDCPQAGAVAAGLEAAGRDLKVRRQYLLLRSQSLGALQNQYSLLSVYLDSLGRAVERPQTVRTPQFRVEFGSAALGKFGQAACGDRGAHFAGTGARYYVVLCDGMGSGDGAARESGTALQLLTGMLQSGLPPEAAMTTLNDLYVLRRTGGFSTAELVELHLDTGKARLYKWGSAPSYLKYRSTARPLGVASPPPGLGIGPEHRPQILELTLRRGEILVLVTDGLAGPELRERIAAFSSHDVQELARELVRSCPDAEDDCTAAAILLRPDPSIE